jgi:hypothetical protein
VRKRTNWIIPGFLVMVLVGILAILPASAAPSGATGAIALTGGHNGLFYSDQTGFNIATATVTDTDLSSQRTGVMRFLDTGDAVVAFDLDAGGGWTTATGILEGEIKKTDTFTATAGQTVFTSTKKPRDADGDGVLDTGVLDIQIKKNGVALVAADWATVYATGVTTLAAGAAVGDKIEITYEYSEFVNQTTPIGAAGVISFLHGNTYANATISKLVVGADSATSIVTTSTLPAIAGAVDDVIITFKYEVIDTTAKLVTFASPSLSAKGYTRQITGTETTATSNAFTAKVAMFSGSDFDKIYAAANLGGVTHVDGIEAAAGITGTGLVARIGAAATALGISAHDVAGTDDTFVSLIVPVADGEVLTATYSDGGTSRVDSADMDMKAPTVTVVGPSSGSYTNNLAQTLIVDITDEVSAGGKASGLVKANAQSIMVLDPGDTAPNDVNISEALEPLLVASNSFRVSRNMTFTSANEGTIKWWAATKDNVGNVPSFTDSRTAAQIANGVANTAIKGSGDPTSTATKKALPGNTVSLVLDVTPASPTTNPGKTGGKVDTALAVIPTGSHSAAGAHTTVLTDAQASFITSGVAAGHKVTNLTDGSSCTVNARTATTVTCAAILTSGQSFNQGDNYKVTNGGLNQILASNSATSNVEFEFDTGTGGAGIDSTTLTNSDFTVVGSTISSITIGTKVSGKQKLLIGLAAALDTAAKPKVELTGEVKDLAGNTIAAFSGTAGKATLDGLKPVVTAATITGGPAQTSVTLAFTSGEAAANTPVVTAALAGHDGGTSLNQGGTVAIGVTSTGTNSWTGTIANSAIVGASTGGLVNVVVSVTDAAGNVGTKGTTDPDGTTAGTIAATALTFQFDRQLNEGVNAVASVFVVSPNTGTAAVPATDVANPFITVNFDNTAGNGGEDKEYTVTSGGDPDIEVDSHKGVTLTAASLTAPDGTVTDVLASMSSVDTNSYVFASSGMAVGTHKLVLNAQDAAGNVSTSVGSTTPTAFTLSLKVTARADYSLTVNPGFNLISLPAAPSTTAIADLLTDATVTMAMTYDNPSGLWQVATRVDGAWTGNLTTIDANHAYWIQSGKRLTIKFPIPRTAAGTAVFPTVINVYKGWNMVPASDPAQRAQGTDIDEDALFSGLDWAAAQTYNPTTASYTKVTKAQAGSNLDVGSGYMLYVNKDGVIIP